jgi:hypothetical protein
MIWPAFFSFKGLCYLIVVVTIGFALAFFEFGGLTALAISLQRRERIRMRQLFGFLGLRPPSLAAFGAAIPDLPRHRAAVPRSRRRSISDVTHRKRHQLLSLCEAAAVLDCPVGCIVAGLGFAFFAVRRFVRWIYSVPLLLFTNASPAAALRESTSSSNRRSRRR